jgi:beta-glucosidase/6-phospho-beta-glucosidase/beta-galactosidase
MTVDTTKLSELRLPPDFRFGVSTSGYQTEGGYNGDAQPRNNWFDWERAGRIEPSGVATDSWGRFADDLSAIAAMGCDTYNFSVEWARIQPSTDGANAQPPFDSAAIDRYAEMVICARSRGIEPIVTLHHFTHPRWLGLDFWQQTDSPAVFATYAAYIVERLNERLCAHKQRPIQSWVTSAESNVLALETWFTGVFPGGGFFQRRATACALDHLLAAHVLSYDAVHDVYERRGWPAPKITTNNFSFATYEIDQGLTDLLLARRRGVAREDLWSYLLERRARWYDCIKGFPGPSRSRSEHIYWQLARELLSAGMSASVEAIYASRRRDKLDALAIDFYDPWLAGRLRAPWRRTDGWRIRVPARPQWEDPSRSEVLCQICRLVSDGNDGLELWVLENGMCNRVYNGTSFPRRDGLTRPRYLHDHIAAVARAVTNEVPISCYVHWTLYDNYEWGSYQPRYGLYAIDRRHGCTRLERDSMGDDSAGAYKAIIDAMRSA